MLENIRKGSLIADTEIYGKHIASLLIFCKIAGRRIEIFVQDRLLFAPDFFFQFFIRLMVSDDLSDLQHLFHRFDVKIGVHKGRGDVDRVHIIDKAHRRHAPVSQAPLACPVRNHQIFLAVRFQIVKIVKHLGIELLQNLLIAIIPVKYIGHHHNGTAPAARATAGRNIGRRILHMAGDGILAVRNILNPFPVKFLPVQLNHRRIAGQLTVSGVASPLHMGAVGWDSTVHIVQLGPKIGFPKPVQRLIAGGKSGTDFYITVDHDAVCHFRISLYLKILKTKPGEAAVHAALRSVGIEDGLLFIGIFLRQATFLIQQFPMQNCDFLPRRRIRYQYRIACDNFSGIIDPHIAFFCQKARSNMADHPVCRAVLYVKMRLRRFFQADRCPVGIIVRRLHPGLVIIPVIMNLPFQKVRLFHIAFLPFVAAVRAGPVCLSLFILPVDHIAELDVAVLITFVGHLIPARPHEKSNRIFSLFQIRSNVINRAIQAVAHLLIVGNSAVKLLRSFMKIRTQRQKQIVAHLFPIDKNLKNAKTRYRDLRRGHFRKTQRLPDHRRTAGSPGGNPLCSG